MTSPLNLSIYFPALSGAETRVESAVAFEDSAPALALFAKGVSGVYLQARGFRAAPSFLVNSDRVFPFSNGRELYLPEALEVFPSREENWRVLRLYAGVQAYQWEAGTFDRPDPLEVGESWGERYNPDIADRLSWIRFFLGRFRIPGLAGEIFIAVETARVTASMARSFPGLGADLRWFLPPLEALSDPIEHPRGILWNLFFRLLDCSSVPGGTGILERAAEEAAPAVAAGSSLMDSLKITASLYSLLEPRAREMLRGGRTGLAASLEDLFLAGLPGRGDRRNDGSGGMRLEGGVVRPDDELVESLDELRFVPARLPAGEGRYLTEEDTARGTREAAGHSEARRGTGTGRPGGPEDAPGTRPVLLPEWDYLSCAYRRDWVSVYPLDRLSGAEDPGRDLLAGWEDLVREVTRQFRMLRYEDRAWRKRLEDGDEVDLDQVVQEEVERRRGLPPSEKVYMEKRRRGREVSALLLVDLSASTSYRIEDGEHRGDTVLQVLLAGVAVMAQALEQLGDRYGVFGFSGYGRDRVELLRIKPFDKPLDRDVLARMGRIRSQRSTRMGAAVRYAHRLLESEPSSLRLLIALSDGFPQDFDYGDDRNDREYGLRDTARALLETEMDGIVPFCISVDSAGHDYLRRMYQPGSYMVMRAVQDLPRELPKIYMRLRNQ